MLGGLESIIMIQTWTDKITQSEQVFVFFFPHCIIISLMNVKFKLSKSKEKNKIKNFWALKKWVHPKFAWASFWSSQSLGATEEPLVTHFVYPVNLSVKGMNSSGRWKRSCSAATFSLLCGMHFSYKPHLFYEVGKFPAHQEDPESPLFFLITNRRTRRKHSKTAA